MSGWPVMTMSWSGLCCSCRYQAMQLCCFLLGEKLATVIPASASSWLCSYAAVYFGLHLDTFKVKSWQRIWPFLMLCQKGFSWCWLTWCWVVPAGCLLFQVARKVFLYTCCLHLDIALFLAWEPSLSRCSLHLQEKCHWKGKLCEPVFSLAFNPIAQQST